MQHYDRRGQYDIALRKIDEAIEHTPTVIDLYLIKVFLTLFSSLPFDVLFFWYIHILLCTQLFILVSDFDITWFQNGLVHWKMESHVFLPLLSFMDRHI